MPSSESDRPRDASPRACEPDSHFDPDECLYMRCASNQVLLGRIDPTAIRLPSQSVNRSEYSMPEDVLELPIGNHGIVQFVVNEVSFRMRNPKSPSDVKYVSSVVHDPLPHNYSHSEIRIEKADAGYRPKLKIKQPFKLVLQARIAERSRVIRMPS